MVNLKKELYIFILLMSVLVSVTACILMGHNSFLIKLIAGIGFAVFGLSGYKTIKEAKANGKDKKEKK